MNMKKLLYALLAVLLVATLSACAPEDADDNNAFDDYKDQTVVITEWTDAEKNTFYFESVDNERITITGFSSTNYRPHAVKLPAYIDGRAVVGISDSAFANSSVLESLQLPAASDYDKVPTSKAKAAEESRVPAFVIGDYAFRGCVALKAFEIPSYVTSIGANAFYGCDAMTTLTFADGCALKSIPDYAFAECKSLTAVTIPAGMESIGKAAFFNCSALESLVIADGVTTIGDQAFQNCVGMKRIDAPATITEVGLYAFSGCNSLEYASVPTWVIEPLDKSNLINVTLVAGESIPASAFKSCEKLETVVIDCNLYEIGESAFVGCKNLREIEIPATVTSIGRAMFKNCSSLTKIAIPQNATFIGASAFSGCSSLEEISIPAAVTEIGDQAFASCFAIKAITVEAGNPVYAAVNNTLYSKDMTVLMQYAVGSDVTAFAIPETVVEVKPSAFAGGKNLTSIIIPDSVKTVGKYAFDGCVNISTATLPIEAITSLAKDGLVKIVVTSGTELAPNAFADCVKLESVVLPDTVTVLGDGAFRGCVALCELLLPAGVTKIGASLFSGCESLTVAAIPAGVTSIGKEAFFGCKSLAEVVIPAGVTEVGENAFRGCASVTAFNVPAGLTKIGANAFGECTSLLAISVDAANTAYAAVDGDLCNKAGDELIQYALGKTADTVVFPESVTKIAAYAFQGAANIKYLTIPETVTTVGEGAFANCVAIETATVPTWALGKFATDGLLTLTVTAGTEIGANVLANAPKLETVLIPATVEKIDKTAFDGCVTIKNANVPNAAISALPKVALETLNISTSGDIAKNAFKDCVTLKTVTFVSGTDEKVRVEKIGSEAFRGCTALESIATIDVLGWKELGDGAFRDCSSLKEIYIGRNVKKIGTNALAGTSSLYEIRVHKESDYFVHDTNKIALYNKNGTKLVQYATGNKDYSFVVPEGVESIESNAFAGAIHLVRIELPTTLEKINSAAFTGCVKLIEIKNLSDLSIVAGKRGHGNISIQTDEALLNIYDGKSGATKISEKDGLILFTSGKEIIVMGRARADSESTMNVGKNVTQIAAGAFDGISFMTVVFGGTKAEWDALPKGENWDGARASYTVQCSDATFTAKNEAPAEA